MNHAQDNLTDEQADLTRIVSVNSRGGASTGLAGKVAFAIVVVGLAVAGTAAGVNQYRKNAGASPETKADTVPRPPVPNPRIFTSDPPFTPPLAGNALASGTASPNARVCPDGQVLQHVLDKDGQLVLGITGQPTLACTAATGGEFGVPPPAPPMPSRAAVAPGSQAVGQPSAGRYGGDVVLPQPQAAATHVAGPPMLDPTGAVTANALPASNASPQDAASSGSSRGAVAAVLLGDRDMVIPQGRSIDCNLSMRLINDVSGKATCVLSSHVYSDSGRVVLAERGSTAVGDYVATTEQGQRRIYVLWSRLQTPRGVVIDIDSPAADALGTTGLPGSVDNRWAERIGAAVMLSLVEDAISYQTAKAMNRNASDGQGIAVLNSTTETGRSLAERILDSTINIKPSIYKNQGDRATIFVSRDLNFGGVYALRAK